MYLTFLAYFQRIQLGNTKQNSFKNMIDVGVLTRCCHLIQGLFINAYCMIEMCGTGCQAVDSVCVWYMCYMNRWAVQRCILFLLSLVHFFNLNWNWKILLWGNEFWVKSVVKKIYLKEEYFIYWILLSVERKSLKSSCCTPYYAYCRGLESHSWLFDLSDFLVDAYMIYKHIYIHM